MSNIFFLVEPLSPLCLFCHFFCKPPIASVKIAITEAIVAAVEALVLGRLDAVVQVTAKGFKKR